MKVFKNINIGLILVLALTAVIFSSGCIQPQPSPPPVNISDIITPSQAYIICDEESCPVEPVYIQGKMSRSSTTYGLFVLTDDENTIYINLRDSDASLIDTIIFHEKTNLQKDGIVEVRVKGTIRHEMGMCDMGGCVDMVRMKIELEETEVIRKVGCGRIGRTTSELGDCFDVSYREISIEDAYSNFFSSKVCTEKGRRPSGNFYYDKEEDKWAFGIFSPTRPGGCTEGCQIYKDRIVFVRTCAVGGPGAGQDLTLEEKVEIKSINELYEECIKGNLDDKPKYGPAGDEPVGATRNDSEGNVWTKQEDGWWKTPAHPETGWGNFLINQQPGGINYGYYPIECDVHLKRSLWL